MILYLVRHAWAEERDPARWPDDGLRPLTAAGVKRFHAVAKQLAKRGMAPQQIFTSPLLRCVQTAEILRQRCHLESEAPQIEALAPGAQLEGVLAAIGPANDAAQQAWVGHSPDVGQLLAALVGDGSAKFDFAKGAVARIDFQGPIIPGAGNLRWLATARLLGE